jgi:hypothetical protein
MSYNKIQFFLKLELSIIRFFINQRKLQDSTEIVITFSSMLSNMCL